MVGDMKAEQALMLSVVPSLADQLLSPCRRRVDCFFFLLHLPHPLLLLLFKGCAASQMAFRFASTAP